MNVTLFWNNKGGTGKTSLAFQAITAFAHLNGDKRILVVDMCPQANLSELLLGGLEQNGSANLLKVQGQVPRATIGGYFQTRLPQPYTAGIVAFQDFLSQPYQFNKFVPDNIQLLAGDPLLNCRQMRCQRLQIIRFLEQIHG